MFGGELEFISELQYIAKNLKKDDMRVKIIPKIYSTERLVYVFFDGKEEDIRRIYNFLSNHCFHGGLRLYDKIYKIQDDYLFIKRGTPPEALDKRSVAITIKGKQSILKNASMRSTHQLQIPITYFDWTCIAEEIKNYFKNKHGYLDIECEVLPVR
jgi:hypothetical protein